MAASSITRNFIISEEEQAEKFVQALEESYQESLHRKTESDIKITYLRGPEAVKQFMEKRKHRNDG